jgi:death-on-curing protein
VNPPAWVNLQALLLLHAETLAEHGGLEGIRDQGLLESALARPQNLFAYENISDNARLAAAYATAIARNHPFADGNKRAAFLAAGLFLALNGRRLVADKADATRAMLATAAGTLPEPDLAAWFAANMEAR